jgi:hypothetical protein
MPRDPTGIPSSHAHTWITPTAQIISLQQKMTRVSRRLFRTISRNQRAMFSLLYQQDVPSLRYGKGFNNVMLNLKSKVVLEIEILIEILKNGQLEE